MDNLNINWEFASKLAGKSPEELKEALTVTGEDETVSLADNYSEVLHGFILDKFKGAEREKLKGVAGKAVKDRMSKIEEVAKPIFSTLEIDLTDNFEESLTTLSEKISDLRVKGPGKDLSGDDIKKLPGFQDILTSEVEALNQKFNEVQSEYEQYKAGVIQKEQAKKVDSYIVEVLNDSNAVWGDDKSAQFRFFKSGLNDYNIQFGDDMDSPSLLDSDGLPARDEYKNEIAFKDYILNQWKLAGHTFHTVPPENDSTNANRSGASGGNFKVSVTSPQDYERLLKQYQDDPDKKSAVRRAWAEYQSKSS